MTIDKAGASLQGRKSTGLDAASFIRNLIATPFIYGLLVPLIFMDVAVSLYQAVCFRLWAVPQVIRGKFVTVSRHELAYLNPLQRMNCAYCSYANGVVAYAGEIASQTEQYWCPIKHGSEPPTPHSRYAGFLAYGEAEDISHQMALLRQALQSENWRARAKARTRRTPERRCASPVKTVRE